MDVNLVLSDYKTVFKGILFKTDHQNWKKKEIKSSDVKDYPQLYHSSLKEINFMVFMKTLLSPSHMYSVFHAINTNNSNI